MNNQLQYTQKHNRKQQDVLTALNMKYAGNRYHVHGNYRAPVVKVLEILPNPFVGGGPEYLAYVEGYDNRYQSSFTDYLPI